MGAPEASSTEENNKGSQQPEGRKKRRVGIIILALLILGACGCAGAFFGTHSTSEQALPPDGDSPTEEDCLAVSQGMKVGEQDEMASNLAGLKMDFVVASNVNIELLQLELEAQLQRDVLPLLVGCNIEGHVSIENNMFLIENAVLKIISINEPTTCNSNSEELCSSVYLELDIFSKEGNGLDESVLILITDVFQAKESWSC